jgi:hypothetical protein
MRNWLVGCMNEKLKTLIYKISNIQNWSFSCNQVRIELNDTDDAMKFRVPYWTGLRINPPQHDSVIL